MLDSYNDRPVRVKPTGLGCLARFVFGASLVLGIYAIGEIMYRDQEIERQKLEIEKQKLRLQERQYVLDSLRFESKKKNM